MRIEELTRLPVALVLAAAVLPTPLASQEAGGCSLLCTPELKFEPTITVENLFGGPRVAELEDGVPTDTVTLEREMAFEMIFALDVPTEIPRVGLTLEAIWTPFAGTSENLFTGRTAEELGEEEVRTPARGPSPRFSSSPSRPSLPESDTCEASIDPPPVDARPAGGRPSARSVTCRGPGPPTAARAARASACSGSPGR